MARYYTVQYLVLSTDILQVFNSSRTYVRTYVLTVAIMIKNTRKNEIH